MQKVDKKKSILVYCTQLAPTGGIESHVVQFCSEMCQQGYSIRIVCGNNQINSAWKKELEKSSFCNTRRIENPIARIAWIAWQGLKARIYNCSLLYTNGQGSSVYIFAKLSGIKNWVHHHHMSGDQEDEKKWTRLYRRAMSSCRT